MSREEQQLVLFGALSKLALLQDNHKYETWLKANKLALNAMYDHFKDVARYHKLRGYRPNFTQFCYFVFNNTSNHKPLY